MTLENLFVLDRGEHSVSSRELLAINPLVTVVKRSFARGEVKIQ